MSVTEQQADAAILVLKRTIDAAENSNQAGEDAVVAAAAGPALLAAGLRARSVVQQAVFSVDVGTLMRTVNEEVLAELDAAIAKARGLS